jgi:hypothetical protein
MNAAVNGNAAEVYYSFKVLELFEVINDSFVLRPDFC